MTTHLRKSERGRAAGSIGLAIGTCLAIAPFGMAWGQATLLPNAVQQWIDGNGNPLASGKVYHYVPGATQTKTVWQDSAQTIPWSNPIVLNAAGEPSSSNGVYGSGSYRQVVYDSLGNLLYDAVTASTGTSSSSGTAGDGMPLGFVMPFSGITPPSGYDWAAGQALSRTTYADLLTAITINQTATCSIGSASLTALTDTSQMGVGQAIESACLAPGTTIATITGATSITVSAVATASGSNSVRVFPYGNGNGATTFNIPDMRGRAFAGRDNMPQTPAAAAAANRLTVATRGGGWDFLGAGGGIETHTLLQAELPAFKPALTSVVTDPGHTHNGNAQTLTSTGGNTGQAGADFARSAAAQATSSSTTGITVATTFNSNLGSATPFTLVQPTLTVNYIIKISANSGTFSVAVANNTVMGNNSGSTAAPVAITASAVLDMFCSTRGSIAERGASGWTCLPPAAAGMVLASGGAGADPLYIAATGSCVGCALLSGNNTWSGTNAFTNTITCPTKGLGDDSTSCATTEFVQNTVASMSLNVKGYGATGDGVTDDYAAIIAADAAAALAGTALSFPCGTYIVSQTVNILRNNVVWGGSSSRCSVIKLQTGSLYDTAFWLGERTATTQYSGAYIHDLGFDGNATATNAAAEFRNMTASRFENLRFTNSLGHGLVTETSTASSNTNNLRNTYDLLEADTNVMHGFFMQGGKDDAMGQMFSHNNTLDGFYFKGSNLGPNLLAEYTTSMMAQLLSRDNGRNGFTMDMVEKFNVASMTSSINGGYGLKFLSSITTAASNGSNSLQVGTFVSRNDALGAIRAADNSYVYGASFGSIWIRGDNSTVSGAAIELDAVQSTTFGEIHAEAWPGTVLHIAQGTPLGGGATQSSDLTFGSLLFKSNGNAGAATNHGIFIDNSSTQIQINSINSANSQTSGTNFEIRVGASVGTVLIGDVYVSASGGAGNNISISNSSTFTGFGLVGTRILDGSSGSPAYTFGADVTTGFYRAGSGLTGYSSAGTERIRLGLGLMVGTTTDPGAGIINVNTGFRVANAATSGNVLRGNGTNFIPAQLAAADLSNGTTGSGAVALAAAPSFTSGITVTGSSTFNVATSNITAFNFNVQTAANQVGFGFSDAGSTKWALYKDTGNTLNFFDNTNSVTTVTMTQGAINAGTFKINLTTAATTATTGALQVAGGMSVNGRVFMDTLSADTASTDRTVCRDTTSFELKTGTGASGVCLGTSSARYKRDISAEPEGLSDLMKLRPVTFHYLPGYGGEQLQHGFIAEDVIESIPTLVGLDTLGRPNSVDMLAMVPILVKSVQELKNEVDRLSSGHGAYGSPRKGRRLGSARP